MTDVLYINGKSEDAEVKLRASLRSLCRHASNIGRVVVAGYCPKWLSKDVTTVNVEDVTDGGFKHINILNCILRAIDIGAVRGRFLYSSNDHFFGADVDLDRFPIYVRPGHLLSIDEIRSRLNRRETMYEASLDCTRRILAASHLDTRLWCNHINTWMDVQDAEKVKLLVSRASQYDRDNFGFEPTCMFRAVAHARDPRQFIVREDVKIHDVDGDKMCGAYSIGDWEDCTNELQAFIRTEFADTCRFESEPKKRVGRKADK